MIKSMTGFGKAEVVVNGNKIVAEIRSLNSKQLDVSNLRMPMAYKEKELDIRNKLSQHIQRGKVDLHIGLEKENSNPAPTINSSVFKSYYEQIKSISSELNLTIENEPLVQTIAKLPEIFSSENKSVNQEEWDALNSCIDLAISNLNGFREQEGQITENDLLSKVNKIQELLIQVEPFENERIETIRTRINENLDKLEKNVIKDMNRFEQELVYYIEKFDINEEKVRLANHCKYFIDTVNEDEPVGRKLGFISQEMGREINTLGSKANHTQIQKIVVQMKDELEKIKEQLLNVL